MNITKSLLFCCLTVCTANQLPAGDLPREHPKYLTIAIESVKPGVAAAHAKHEAGWPAAMEKAKSPDYYLALTSMSGVSQAWYLSPWESHQAMADSLKRETKDEALSKALDALAAKDSEFISGTRVVQTMGRRDLSVGEFPDVRKARFFEVTTFRIRPGFSHMFEEASKAYAAAAKRADPDVSYRVYQVIAGMPGPTYLFFSTVTSFGEFDKRMESEQATWKGATPEEMGILQKCGTEAIMEMEANRFRLDPKQSYVSKEVREMDSEFWNGK